MLALFYSEEFLDHDTGTFHPERPERLTAIVKTLKAAPWADSLDWILPSDPAQRNVLLNIQKVHNPQYIKQVEAIANRGGGQIDGDTPVSARSYDVALLAVSAWLDGVDKAIATGNPVFVLARPPGHHALKDTGMGFCLFSNGAIAAHYALELPGINRVAILDWDVHHGNGTEALVEDNPQIRYCSLHQSPCYPGTGRARDRGKHENVLNIPMSRGSELREYQPAFEELVVPFLREFEPDLLIVSAGYDANHDDPLAGISLQPSDYGIFTDYCLGITRRIVFGLEGGYDLDSLAASVKATLETCLRNQKLIY